MIPYARLRPGPGFEVKNAALYFTQRLVVTGGLRRTIAQVIAAVIRHSHGGAPWGPVDARFADAPRQLRDDGIALLDGLVSQEAVDAITKHLAARPVLLPGGSLVPIEERPAGTTHVHYPLDSMLDCPELLNLVNAPPVLRIAAAYLGCKPTLSSLAVRWSFPTSRGPGFDTQQYHRDPDDWRFLKLLVYLTDVTDGAGPHSFVRGSHRTHGQVRAHLYPLSSLLERYGPQSIETIVGPRGTAFLADTYGIHAGMPPTTSPRLLLLAQYSLLPVFAFKYSPCELNPKDAVDTYVNRLMLCGPKNVPIVQ